MVNDFLPVSMEDINKRGWQSPDFIVVTGDAYVDHPSFGAAVISRLLEAEGFKVAILAQPDWRDTKDFIKLGRPRIGFMVTAGNIDSMVAHYTAAKKRRNDDKYSPGGKAGKRPDRAVIVYCNKIREAWGDIPIIIGGIEASLRRFAHYDYWSDTVRNSILVDSGADILVYGMGESQTKSIASRLNDGENISQIDGICGTCVIRNEKPSCDYTLCSSFEMIKKSKTEYAKACKVQFDEQDPIRGKCVVQPFSKKFLIQYPPAMPLKTEEFDRVYDLPYMRAPHPEYDALGGVPAIEEIEFSIISCRGCFGACNFCSLAFHQGRIITVRSHESIVSEARGFIGKPNFKGYIHDVGGPTANFRQPACQNQLKTGACKDRRCLSPEPCKKLEVDHTDYISLLNKLRAISGVKKVFIRSGLRFDYIMLDKSDAFFKTLVENHISGQLKIAPEHCSSRVLKTMGKAPFSKYLDFYDKYFELNRKLNKEQYIVPYLMSSHPGSTIGDAIELALYLKKIGYNPEQVQDFYPTPGTVSTCMFYTGIDPMTGNSVYIPRSQKEKTIQRALLQFRNPKNRRIIIEALKEAGRDDLIGHGKGCLITPGTGVPYIKKGASKDDKHYKSPQKPKGEKGMRPQTEKSGKRR